jgi:5-methylcytosine-specific restriction protein A
MEVESTRNPTWTRDELILTLDFYFRYKGNPPPKNSAEMIDLSNLLNELGKGRDGRTEKFRNENGVHMKIMNFRRFDPHFLARGVVGLSRGGKGEEEVWNNFFQRPSQLRAAADAIKASLQSGVANLNLEEEEVAEAEEGRLLTRVHLSRERNRDIVKKKKDEVLKKTGKLECEACDFNFALVYGQRGEGFAEVHHIKPLHTLVPGTKTRLDDLAILCSNCHRMVHAKQPWLDVTELRKMIRKKEL